MIIALFGRSGAGKSAVLKELQKAYPEVPQLKLTTTRPPRNDNDNEYHFISEDKFGELIKKGKLVAVRSFKTFIEGCEKIHYYAINVDDYNADVMFLSIDFVGFQKALVALEDVYGIFIFASKNTCFRRLSERADNEAEVIRRLDADDTDFDLNVILNYAKNPSNHIRAVISNNDFFQEAVYDTTQAIEKLLVEQEVNKRKRTG